MHELSACLQPAAAGSSAMGETMQDRISMAFTLRSWMWTRSRQLPHARAGNAFCGPDAIMPLAALHAIALLRPILPKKEIRVCGGQGKRARRSPPPHLPRWRRRLHDRQLPHPDGLDPRDDLQMIADMGFRIRNDK